MLCCDASLIRVNVAPCMYMHGSTLVYMYIYICVTDVCAHAQTISRGSWAGGGNHLRRLKELCARYAKPMRQGWDGMGWGKIPCIYIHGATLTRIREASQHSKTRQHDWSPLCRNFGPHFDETDAGYGMRPGGSRIQPPGRAMPSGRAET